MGKRRYRSRFSQYKKPNHKSPEETQIEKYLKECAGKKYVVEYETEKLSYNISFNYIPDFILKFKDGRTIYIEAKGYLDYDTQRKMRAVKESHPEKDIRFVFYRDKLVNKGGKMRYSDWADKYGYPYAIGTVPKEWLV